MNQNTIDNLAARGYEWLCRADAIKAEIVHLVKLSKAMKPEAAGDLRKTLATLRSKEKIVRGTGQRILDMVQREEGREVIDLDDKVRDEEATTDAFSEAVEASGYVFGNREEDIAREFFHRGRGEEPPNPHTTERTHTVGNSSAPSIQVENVITNTQERGGQFVTVVFDVKKDAATMIGNTYHGASPRAFEDGHALEALNKFRDALRRIAEDKGDAQFLACHALSEAANVSQLTEEERAKSGIGKYGLSDPLAKLHPNEPYFFIRAQDSTATETIEFYADELEERGLKTHAAQLREEVVKAFEDWQIKNADKVKLPD